MKVATNRVALSDWPDGCGQGATNFSVGCEKLEG